MNETPVSAVIITLNNARSIRKTLESVRWCSETLIVDSGSTDETLSICHEFGCRIIHHEFEGYGKQKHFAVSQAVNIWTLVIDADEVCLDETAQEIRQKVSEREYSAFRIPISLVFMGRMMRFGGEYKKKHLRLFDRSKGQYNFDEVHEDVVMNEGKTGDIQNHFIHHSYADTRHYITKLNEYTSKGAFKLYKKNKAVSPLIIALRIPFDFIKWYFIKGLVFDGFPGFVWSLFSSFYSAVKYIKLYEMSKEE